MYFTPSVDGDLGQVGSLPLYFTMLSAQKGTGQLFGRTFLNLVLCDATPCFSPGSAFCQMYPRRNVVSSSVHRIRRHTMSVCPIDGDIHFDNLVKMVFSRFVYYKATIIFPLWK